MILEKKQNIPKQKNNINKDNLIILKKQDNIQYIEAVIMKKTKDTDKIKKEKKIYITKKQKLESNNIINA